MILGGNMCFIDNGAIFIKWPISEEILLLLLNNDRKLHSER